MSIELFRHFDIHEELPDLEAEQVSTDIRRLYGDCIRSADVHGIIWPGGQAPTTPDMASFFDVADQALGRHWSLSLGKLLKTPRALKFWERTLRTSWQRLQGEVSLQELCAVVVLAAAEPRSFREIMTIIGEQIEAARVSKRMVSITSAHAGASFARQRLEQLSYASGSGVELNDIVEVINQLSFGQLCGDSTSQSIAGESRQTVYWGRILSRDLDHDAALSDQKVLGDISSFMKSGDDSALADRILAERDYAVIVEHFSEWFTMKWSRLSELYTSLFEREFSEMVTSRRFTKRESYLFLWRRWLKSKGYQRVDTDVRDPAYAGLMAGPHSIPDADDKHQVLAWLSSMVYSAIQLSISHVNELYYWHSGAPGGSAFLPEPMIHQLRVAIVEYCKTNILTAQDWIDRLLLGNPFALYHLFYHVAGSNQVPVLYQPNDWTWAVPGLRDACLHDPGFMRPFVLFLLCSPQESRARDSNYDSTYRLDRERSLELCGGDRPLLLSLFRSLIREVSYSDTMEPRERQGCEQISSDIIQFINEMESGSVEISGHS